MTPDQVKSLRKSARITQKQAAELTGAKRLQWIRYEHGTTPIPLKRAQALQTAIDNRQHLKFLPHLSGRF